MKTTTFIIFLMVYHLFQGVVLRVIARKMADRPFFQAICRGSSDASIAIALVLAIALNLAR
jgi:Na+/glutamate symporter